MDVLKTFGLELPTKESELIALCGGGGKTTTMFDMACRCRMTNLKVLVTTTTMICRPQSEMYDFLYFEDLLPDLAHNSSLQPGLGTITLIGRGLTAENKLIGLQPETVSQIYHQRIYDIIFTEADGARGRPIKAPAEYEPVIPDTASTVIGIIGMDSYGQSIAETSVHRPQLFSALVDRPIGAKIDAETIRKLILSPEGLFKNAPATAKKVLFINKAERAADIEAAKKIAAAVLKEAANIRRVVIGSIHQPEGLQTLVKED
jgi:probable selenium-dependent hydroxylase accessory protein YqeC